MPEHVKAMTAFQVGPLSFLGGEKGETYFYSTYSQVVGVCWGWGNAATLMPGRGKQVVPMERPCGTQSGRLTQPSR